MSQVKAGAYLSSQLFQTGTPVNESTIKQIKPDEQQGTSPLHPFLQQEL